MVKQMQNFQAGGPMVQARNFAVMTGVNAGLSVAVRRWGKGKVDETYGTCVAPPSAARASTPLLSLLSMCLGASQGHS
jgi:hypothetical protein